MTAAKNLAVVEQAKEQLKGYPRKYHRFENPDYPGTWMDVWFNYTNREAVKVAEAAQAVSTDQPNPYKGTEFVREWSVMGPDGEVLPVLGEMTDEYLDIPNDLWDWVQNTVQNAAALEKEERLGNSSKR